MTESDWYRSIKPTISPGENMRAYRELHGMTQTELGAKLDMENGHRPIIKTTAKRLAEVFGVSVGEFI